MDGIAILFGFVLLAASVFFVARPLRSGVPQKSPAAVRLRSVEEKASPEVRRQQVLIALRDLDFDHQAGKLAEDDYARLRADLLVEAAELLQQREKNTDETIEALIASRRKAHGAMDGSAKKGAPSQCEKCQAPLMVDAKFCSRCGEPVDISACPRCQHRLEAGDLYCPACGTPVKHVAPTVEVIVE